MLHVFISIPIIGENVESSRPDDTWEPVWPSTTQVHCADFKLEKSSATSSFPADTERESFEHQPREQPKKCAQDCTVNSIYNFLRQICVSPPKSSCRTLEWVNGPVCSYRAVDSEYNLAVRKWKTELSHWSFEDFCHHYDVIQPNPVFVPMSACLSVPESMVMIERVLEIQTDGKIEQIANEAYAVMEKTLPKKNCICVISAPSSGKNYVFDATRTF